MKKIYVYVLENLADWEIGYLTAELNSRRFFKPDAPRISINTVGFSRATVKTMGGINVCPDITVKDVETDKDSVLILAGADSWSAPKNAYILKKAAEILKNGGVVAAICGATAALADVDLLNDRKHTSNGLELLKAVSERYKGQLLYVDEKAVSDKNLITACTAAPLLWTKLILEKLEVFKPKVLDCWYKYHQTGNPDDYVSLMTELV